MNRPLWAVFFRLRFGGPIPLFEKGNRANPHGRPKTTNREKVRALARKHTKEAVKILEQIMNDPLQAGRTRLAAAEALLDRGYGRPAQTVEAQDAKGNAVALGVVIVPQKGIFTVEETVTTIIPAAEPAKPETAEETGGESPPRTH